jgi:2-C-methyl-D-erythritol 4-phosphate cytidylyltransferase
VSTESQAVALLLAAGSGERLGAGVPKAVIDLGGRPLVAWSLEALAQARAVRAIVLVGDPRALTPALESVSPAARARIHALVPGGDTRQASCALGLAAAPPDAEIILIHDAARPFAEPSLFDRVAEAAARHGAALAAEPLADTLKRVEGDRVIATLERAGLWRAQTPQGARRAWLVEAHARALADGAIATDDVALIELLGRAVHVVPAPSTNRKITTPEDRAWAEAWLRSRALEAGGGA